MGIFNFIVKPSGFLCLSLFVVIIQSYEAEADNEYVIKGNSAIMKCEIPSFVADFVLVDSWIDSDGQEYYREDNSSTTTIYTILIVNVTVENDPGPITNLIPF